jgi:hypothetical protein
VKNESRFNLESGCRWLKPGLLLRPLPPERVCPAPIQGAQDRAAAPLRALLNAAAEEFGEKGFHDAAISQITARAGVATGSFYVYFDSKEAIFQALVRDLSGQVKDFVGPSIAAAPTSSPPKPPGSSPI